MDPFTDITAPWPADARKAFAALRRIARAAAPGPLTESLK